MSRKLYDLCRKYKYFYKKCEDVKSWNEKYHDIDLSDAVAKTKIDLGLVENDIQKELFDVFGIKCQSIEVENDISRIPWDRFGVSSTSIELKDSKRFVNVLSEYVYSRHCRW